MRKKKILSIVMSVIMILAMVPSTAFAATSSPAPYDVWAYNIDTGKKTVLKMMLDDGTDKPTKAEVLEKLQNTLDDDGEQLVDDDVTEDELEIKFYNGDEGNIKKMLKGKGTEYKFTKAKLRLDHIAMTYEVVKPEHDGTVSFNVYLENDKETPAVTINKDFKDGETYEGVMPTADEIIDALAEKGIEPAAGHHFEVLTDWFGDGAWLYNKEEGSAFDVSEKAENETNLHTLVKEVANKVTVSFDFDGGVIKGNTEWDNLTEDAGHTLNLPYSTEIKKDGYTFLGWSANGSENYIEGGEYVLTEDTHFVAVWAEITHTVSFKAGTLSEDKKEFSPFDDITIDNEIVADGKTVTTTAPEVEGYDFTDWYVEYTDGTYRNDLTKISDPIYKNETFCAVYKKHINEYTATFDFNGGKYTDKEITAWKPIVKNEGTQILLPNADDMKLDGWTFAGWNVYDADNELIATVDTIADRNYTLLEDVNFVAVWTRNVDLVLRNSDGNGKLGGITLKVTKGEATELPDATETFADKVAAADTVTGWYRNAEFKNENAVTVTNADDDCTTYTALVNVATATATFDLDGGSVKDTNPSGTGNIYTEWIPTTVKVGANVWVPTDDQMSKEGYTFAGWYVGDTKVDGGWYVLNEDTDFVAKWADKYKVTFDYNNDTDATTQEIENGLTVNAPDTAPTKTNRTFNGWYLVDKDGNVADEAYDFATPVTEDITLKALYDVKVEYNIYKDGFNNKTDLLKQETAVLPEDTDIEAYLTTAFGETVTPTEFDVVYKWYSRNVWTANYGKDKDIRIAAFADAETANLATLEGVQYDKTRGYMLFALVHTDENAVTITFDNVLYGDKVEPMKIVKGSALGDVAVENVKDGYKLEGWYDDDGTTKVSAGTRFNKNTTLKAKWNVLVTLNVYKDKAIKPTVAEVFAPVGEVLDLNALKSTYTSGGKAFYGWYTPENWANIQKGGDYTFENTKAVDSFTVTEPVEFYGKVSEGFTVTFNAGEGVKAENMPDEQIRYYGEKVEVPTKIPTRTGYTFDGWAYDFESPVYHDTIITAKWSLNTYTITYDPNGGVFVDGANSTRTISYGSEYGKLIDETQISRDGAKFLGWTTVKDDATTLVKAQDKYLVEDDTTLYALWEITGVTVTYVTNGGKVAELDDNVVTDSKGKDISNEKLPYGTKVNDVRKAVKDGLKFEGWYLDKDLTEAYDNAPLTGSITLYAKYYAEITFQIYQNDNYAETIGAKTIKVDEYDKVELPKAEDLGVVLRDTDEFFGWYTVKEFGKVQAGQEAVTVENVTATGEVTYCAKVLRHYTVTFNTNGGTDVKAQDVAYKGLATVPTAPTKVGNEFAGWYSDAACKTPFDFATPITADTTVYANWNRSKVTITFNMDMEWMGGTSSTPTIEIYYGDTIPTTPTTAVPDATFPGYTFDGWYLNGNPFDVATTPVTENITLDAKWHLNQFDAEIVGEYTYTGTGITPEIKVTDSTTKEALDLEANPVDKTYTAVSENAKLDDAGLPVNAGTYKVTVSQKYVAPKFTSYKYCKAAPVELTLEVKPANISEAGRFNTVLENKDGQTAYDPANLVKINFTGSELLLDGTSEEGYKLYVYDTLRKSILDSTVPDFEIEYANNVNAGTATATVTGVGNYTGTLEVKFEIAKLQINIGPYLVIIEPSSYEYNGEVQQPNVTVKKDDSSPELKYGVDYVVGYMPADETSALTNGVPVNVGTYKLVVEGIGNYEGTTNSKPDFKITPKSIKKVDVEFVKSWDYTGEEIKPEVKVKDGGKVLVEGVDYKVSYENNVNASEEAIVRIDGLGNYNDNRKINFTILPKDISNAEVVYETEWDYTESAIEPPVTVTVDGKELVKSTDYTVEYKDNVNAGEATITITGIGNYKGSVEKKFTIKELKIDIRGYVATLNPDTTIYNGEVQKPAITVTPQTTLTRSIASLEEGTEFTVSYKLNGEDVAEPKEAGVYTVVITGVGNFINSIEATYTITAKELTNEMVTVDVADEGVESTGSAIKPTVIVKDGETVLVEGTDYTVEYTNNVEPGTATVTVKGIGNYKGLVEKTFTITSKYYYVTGVVRFSSGRVIKFAKVTLTGTDYLGNEVVRTTKTDKYGKYTIKNLKKGNYIVTYRNESKAALLNEQN